MAQLIYASEHRLLEDTHREDSRIIGEDRFVASLSIAPFRPRSSISLKELAQSGCSQNGISVEELISPRRHSALMRARRELKQRAIDKRIANLSQVAMFLRREPSSVGPLLHRQPPAKEF